MHKEDLFYDILGVADELIVLSDTLIGLINSYHAECDDTDGYDTDSDDYPPRNMSARRSQFC